MRDQMRGAVGYLVDMLLGEVKGISRPAMRAAALVSTCATVANWVPVVMLSPAG